MISATALSINVPYFLCSTAELGKKALVKIISAIACVIFAAYQFLIQHFKRLDRKSALIEADRVVIDTTDRLIDLQNYQNDFLRIRASFDVLYEQSRPNDGKGSEPEAVQVLRKVKLVTHDQVFAELDEILYLPLGVHRNTRLENVQLFIKEQWRETRASIAQLDADQENAIKEVEVETKAIKAGKISKP